MKKCPYCAEEIQDEAIICRYCGRDLALPVPPPKPEAEKPVRKTIWKASQPAVIVITILYVIATFINFFAYPNTGELLGRLTFGLLATFFVWWIFCAFLVWLWRQFGPALSVMLVGAVVLVGIIIFSSNSRTAPAPVPTATRVPTRQSQPQQLLLSDLIEPTRTPQRASNCTWWYEITSNDVGKTMCVQGIADSISGNTETSGMARIYFRNLSAVFYFADDSYYYPNLTEGACVSAIGRISVNEDKILFMRLDGKIEPCP